MIGKEIDILVREPDLEFAAQFAKRVKCRLNVLHMNQHELARRINISDNSMSRYLKGYRRIPFELVCRMAVELKCTPNDLLWDKDEIQ